MPFAQMKSNRRKSSVWEPDLNSEILAGVEFKIKYLGFGELSMSGGTDHEVAQVIHDIYCRYAEHGKKSISKVREVVVFIDTQKINISSQNQDKEFEFINFPLIQVKDITTCLDERPFTQTCVLVARENENQLYKAYVFHCKDEALASKFYETASLAFRIGFKLFEKFKLNEILITERLLVMVANDKSEGQTIETKNGSCNDGNEQIVCKESPSESIEERNVTSSRNGGQVNERKVTFAFDEETDSTSWTNEESKKNIEISLGKRNSYFNQYKLNVFFDCTEHERSEFLCSKWVRRSCCRIREYFRRVSAVENNEEAEISGENIVEEHVYFQSPKRAISIEEIK